MMIITGKAKPVDIYHYWIGNYRYKLYYWYEDRVDWWTLTNLPKRNILMREHIWQQISMRISWMDQECYNNGSCKICGCDTTALQMANKACDKPCYLPMLSRKKWNRFIGGEKITFNDCLWCISISADGKIVPFIQNFKTGEILNTWKDSLIASSN